MVKQRCIMFNSLDGAFARNLILTPGSFTIRFVSFQEGLTSSFIIKISGRIVRQFNSF